MSTQYYLLEKTASIQPRTSPVKFARSPSTDPPGFMYRYESRDDRYEEQRKKFEEFVRGDSLVGRG